MAGYNLIDGYSNDGSSITLITPWKHETSEVRCLAAVDDYAYQDVRVLGAKNFTKNGNVYEFFYPFDKPGLPWRVYLWRITTTNETIFYTGGRVPVEAILSKINELNDKAEEAGLLYGRSIMAPENAEGAMIVPPVNVRKGKLLGFDENGLPTTGEDCEQVKELLSAQTSCEDLVREAQAHAQTASDAASIAGMHAQNAMESIITASDHAEEARDYALTAEGWCQKTAEAGTSAVTRMDNLIWRAETAQTSAEAAADRAEAAIETIRFNNEELDKAIHYVACATEQVERDVETTRIASEEAVSSANSASASASLAKTSETNAAASAGNAAIEALSAGNAAEAAAESAQEAATSETKAFVSAGHSETSSRLAQSSAEYIKDNEEAFGLGTAYVGACRLLGIPPYDEWEQLAFAAVGTWHKQTI